MVWKLNKKNTSSVSLSDMFSTACHVLHILLDFILPVLYRNVLCNIFRTTASERERELSGRSTFYLFIFYFFIHGLPHMR